MKAVFNFDMVQILQKKIQEQVQMTWTKKLSGEGGRAHSSALSILELD